MFNSPEIFQPACGSAGTASIFVRPRLLHCEASDVRGVEIYD
jgi:hypothetical protein